MLVLCSTNILLDLRFLVILVLCFTNILLVLCFLVILILCSTNILLVLCFLVILVLCFTNILLVLCFYSNFDSLFFKFSPGSYFSVNLDSLEKNTYLLCFQLILVLCSTFSLGSWFIVLVLCSISYPVVFYC